MVETEGHPILASPMKHTLWYGPTFSASSSVAPIEPQKWGIHCYRDPREFEQVLGNLVPGRQWAVGLVDCWGDVVVGEYGVVAEHTTIRHLWVPLGTPLKTRALLRQRYGCRVTGTLKLSRARALYRDPSKALIPYSERYRWEYENLLEVRLAYLRRKHWLKLQYHTPTSSGNSSWKERPLWTADLRKDQEAALERLRLELSEGIPPAHWAVHYAVGAEDIALRALLHHIRTGENPTVRTGRTRPACGPRDRVCIIVYTETTEEDTYIICRREHSSSSGGIRSRLGYPWPRKDSNPSPSVIWRYLCNVPVWKIVRHKDGSITVVTPLRPNGHRRSVRFCL